MTVKKFLLQEYEKAIKEVLGDLASEKYTEDTDCDISSEDLDDINYLIRASMGKNDTIDIRTAVKALDLITNKEVDIHNLLKSETCEEYNSHVHWLGFDGNLAEEEYYLLRYALNPYHIILKKIEQKDISK